uniref:C3H1-type domain-containing protein n=2 Tax=Odontella aurita TaxID=265563 RepID=A0A7S4N2V7_9STRA|mmetsp:Transcript_44809/g.136815  ORF Transcript_44809/g.136815 Transcript_44809/m.136815 type:complete len:1372 (+) Transcript_44809:1075-5190(+)
MHCNCRTVMGLLQRGADPRRKDASKKRSIDCADDRAKYLDWKIRTMMPQTQHNRAEFQAMQDEVREAERISELLGVYMDATKLDDQARNVKHWWTCQVTWQRARNLRLGGGPVATAELRGVRDSLFCAVAWDGNPEPPTDVVPLSSDPDWNGVRSHYRFRFNSRMEGTYAGKEIVFRLFKGDPPSRKGGGERVSVPLGSVTENGARMYENASEREMSGEFAVQPSPNRYLQSGSATIALQKLPYDVEYERQKVERLGGELADLVGRVVRFDEKIDGDGKSKKAATAPLLNALAPMLLRCAVALEDLGLAKRLISVGLDPEAGLKILASKELPTEMSSLSSTTTKKDIEELFEKARASKRAEVVRRGDGTSGERKVATSGKTPAPAKDIKKLDELPTLKTAHWMELELNNRCRFFPECERGRSCRYTHVLSSGRPVVCAVVPESTALGTAYDRNFGVRLRQSDCKETIAKDRDGNEWHAAGLICPAERVYYYARGGPGGRENGQGVWLYPTREHAVAAVAITVLDEFQRRGLYCDWGRVRKLEEEERERRPKSWERDERLTAAGGSKRSSSARGDEDRGVKHRPSDTPEEQRKRSKIAAALAPSTQGRSSRVDATERRKNATFAPSFQGTAHVDNTGRKNADAGDLWRKRKSPSYEMSVSSKRARHGVNDDDGKGGPSSVVGPAARKPAGETDLPTNNGGQEGSAIVTEDTGSRRSKSPRPDKGRRRGDARSTSSLPKPKRERAQERSEGEGTRIVGVKRDTPKAAEPPKLGKPDWMVGERDSGHPGWKVKRCPFFRSPHRSKCKYGKKCNNAHVFDPAAAECPLVEAGSEDHLADAYARAFNGASLYQSSRFELRKFVAGRTWFTGAIRCPLENVVYYAEGGSNATKSSQGVYWYPTKEDAFKAADSVLLSSLRQRRYTANNASGDAREKKTLEKRNKRKSSFAGGSVPDEISPDEEGSNVSTLSEPMVAAAASGKFSSGIFFQGLSRSSYVPSARHSSKASLPASGTPENSRFTPPNAGARGPPGPLENIQLDRGPPAPGQVDPWSQGECNSSNPGPAVILPHIKGRKGYHAEAWMLCPPNYHLCLPFKKSGYEGCKRGSDCKFAHIFTPSEGALPTGLPPHPSALKDAYQENFRIRLPNDGFELRPERSMEGTEWFTACFRCPREGTIYLSAGFAGMKSGQNIWWYRTKAEAIAAVEGVILTAFRERQLSARWEPPQRQYPDARPGEDRHSYSSCNERYEQEQSFSVKHDRGEGDSNTGSGVHPLPLEKDLQALYATVFPRSILPAHSFAEESVRSPDGRKVYTVVFKSPAEGNKMYHPQGNGGIEMRGRWWYHDAQSAKRATFPVLAKDLQKRGIIASAKEFLETRCH